MLATLLVATQGRTPGPFVHPTGQKPRPQDPAEHWAQDQSLRRVRVGPRLRASLLAEHFRPGSSKRADKMNGATTTTDRHGLRPARLHAAPVAVATNCGPKGSRAGKLSAMRCRLA